MQTKVDRVIAALAGAGKPVPSSVVAARSGLEPHDASRVLNRLKARGLVTCAKTPGDYGHYAIAPTRESGSSRAVIGSETVQIAERANFLRELLARPAFEGHRVLNDILKDYEHTLRLRQTIQRWADQDEGAAASPSALVASPDADGWRDPYWTGSQAGLLPARAFEGVRP